MLKMIQPFQCFLISVLVSLVLARDCSQHFHGYKIDYGRRACMEGEATDCESPFPYETYEECMRDFMGHGNVCDRRRVCRNNGVCLPVTQTDRHNRRQRGYRCDCLGIGYFGEHCERKCTRHLPRNVLAQACLMM